jgi:predicted component of type VI protein secretion system
MSLILRAVLLDDQPLSLPLEACFGCEGGTIGRADQNTLALPDPLRYISRRQARVSRTPAGFVIENIGGANPIAVRGQPLLQGHCVPLRHRDQLRIGAYVLEVVEQACKGELLPAAGAVEPAGSGDAGLWAAFCEGAGLRAEADPATAAQRLRVAGRLLRHAVAGLLELTAAQPLPPRTPHGGTNLLSNPLRVAPDAQSALELLLLLPPLRGSLVGPQAVAGLLQELQAQAVATGGGARAARDGMLCRFAPTSLEERLRVAAGSGAPWWPAQRQARLWEQYGRCFERLRDQAQVDFDTLFGQAFMAAYEERLQRLQRLRQHGSC